MATHRRQTLNTAEAEVYRSNPGAFPNDMTAVFAWPALFIPYVFPMASHQRKPLTAEPRPFKTHLSNSLEGRFGAF